MGPLQFCLLIFLRIHRNPKQKWFLWGILDGSTNRVRPSRPILKICPFLTPAWNLNFSGTQCLHLKCYESAIWWFYQKFVSGMGLFQKSLTGIENFFLLRVPMNPKKDWKAQLERPHFFKVQSGKMKVDQNWMHPQKLFNLTIHIKRYSGPLREMKMH